MSNVDRNYAVRPVRIHGIRMYPMYSSNILGIGYEDGKLIVLFHTGQVYAYGPVAPQVYKDFFIKESAGSYFAREIKNSYPVTRLTSDQENHAELFRQEMRRIFG